MKLLFDLFPVILFFVSYNKAALLIKHTPIGQWIDPSQPEHIAATIVATAIAIAASFIQVGLVWLKKRRVENIHAFSLVMITVLGGLTIYIGNPAFIQWKPTLLNWLFAVVLLISHHVFGKNLIQKMMGAQISLPAYIWNRLNLAWVIFFIISGLANLYVAFFYGLDLDAKTRMDIWVDFKLFGLMGLTFVFAIGQAFYLARHMQHSEQDNK
jgi:intracellular septation protein